MKGKSMPQAVITARVNHFIILEFKVCKEMVYRWGDIDGEM